MNTRRNFLKTSPIKLFLGLFCGTSAALATKQVDKKDTNSRIKEAVMAVFREEKRLGGFLRS